MRSYRLTLPFVLLCVILACFACNKYKDTALPSNDLPEDKMVTASVQGRVLDENGSPVQGATVTSGTASASTDVNGVFNFNDIKMSSRFGFVKVVKQGYFTGSRSMLTGAASSNYVTITLIPRTSKGTFSATGGGSIAVETGDTVSFDASSVVNAATNATYTGTVHVFAAYLDPLANDRSEHMPGDLRGIDSSGKETMLHSYGMMVVELEGDGGEKLQIAAGKQASLSMKIPDALKANTPATIPLWYFNDTTGRWIQQGTAIRKGDQFCGQTNHFTWWNCDAPVGVVNLKVTLKDQHGIPLAYTGVRMTSPPYGTTMGYTDASGFVSGLIPKGQALSLSVISSCGTVLAGANVGPALTDQDLGTLVVQSDISTLTLSGTVVNCNNVAVDSGFVNIVLEGLNYRGSVSKGAFLVNITRCAVSTTTAKLVAGDFKTLQQGSALSLAVDTGKKVVGQLSACGISFDQFINITVDGKTYSVTAPPDSISYSSQSSYSLIWAEPKYGTTGNRIGFVLQNLSGTGTYSPTNFYLFNASRAFVQATDNSVQCTVTTFGDINEFILGDLSGMLKDSVSRTDYPLTGSFKIKRSN